MNFYCGIRTSNVRASKKAGRSRNGKSQKLKRSHSRRRCYKTADSSLNSGDCMVGATRRCVIRGKNPDRLEARRSKARSLRKGRRVVAVVPQQQPTYAYGVNVYLYAEDLGRQPSPKDLLQWYVARVNDFAELYGLVNIEIIPTMDRIGRSTFQVSFKSMVPLSNGDLIEIDGHLENPDDNGNYPLNGRLISAEMLGKIERLD